MKQGFVQYELIHVCRNLKGRQQIQITTLYNAADLQYTRCNKLPKILLMHTQLIMK